MEIELNRTQCAKESQDYWLSEGVGRRPYVMKFGGTSVGNARAIEGTVSILRRYYSLGWPLVAVLSAMSGITNGLVSICDGIQRSDRKSVQNNLDAILDTHTTAVSELRFSVEQRAVLRRELRELFVLLHESTQAGGMTPERKDCILSFGERMNSRIVAAACRKEGIKSLAVDATEIIETDDSFGEAKPVFERSYMKTRRLLNPLLGDGCLPVVTGFIGKTADGRVATLGRGGSDYTASYLGRILHACEVWIWTDVNGIYTADPNKDPSAEIISEMSFRRADEMAKNGAKVLYTKTVEPLLGTDTILRVKNTFNPDFAGTKIVNDIEGL